MTCATLWQRKPTHAFAIFRLLVYRLAVLCEYRRRRVGLALVRAGEEHLRGRAPTALPRWSVFPVAPSRSPDRERGGAPRMSIATAPPRSLQALLGRR
jgi:hypothetical protein